MDLSIIIVNWNTGNLLRECISSIINETKKVNYEIIICDNNSCDDSAKIYNTNQNNIKVIYSKENLGFSKGNNLAIKEATGKYLLLLNPDTIILNNAIDKAYDFIINKPQEVLIGAKLLNKDKSIQLSSCKFPTPINLVTKKYIIKSESHNFTHYTDWVMGAFMMINTDFYHKIGGLDEDFFMYSEDLDLCYQVKKNKGSIIHYSDAEIIHLYNQSGSKKWNSNREKVITQSLILFLNKNYFSFNRIICVFLIRIRYLIKKLLKRR